MLSSFVGENFVNNFNACSHNTNVDVDDKNVIVQS